MPSRVSSEPSLLSDSSILSASLTTPTRSDSTASVTSRSSTDVSLCLPSLDRSPPVADSTLAETSTTPETPSTRSPTVSPPSSALTPSLPLASFRSSPLLASSSAASCVMFREPETSSSETSATATSTSAGINLTRRPSSRSVPSSSTTAVPPCSVSLDLWSTRRLSRSVTTRIFPSLDTSPKSLTWRGDMLLSGIFPLPFQLAM
mmetsp:Transcript_114934/g.297897  ORF Transcript_114934/g.297897 Transcript_114934/m.297897 type:complete len:205 (+) Transcript_114934:86-700(+)